MNWLFKGSFDNFFLKIIFDFNDYMISIYLNKDGKIAAKTKMTEFQANYFITTSYPTIYLSSSMLNNIKILTDIFLMSYILADPKTFVKVDPTNKDAFIPRGDNKLVAWLAKTCSMQRMLIWDIGYLKNPGYYNLNWDIVLYDFLINFF